MKFGRYTLLNKIAVGGMAEIFLAQAAGEAGFQRACVVKKVLPHLVEDPVFVKMFLNEAEVAARLHHPGIVQIFDLGREGDDYFLAMEYLPGESLAALFARAREIHRPVPIGFALEVAALAADALHHAHALGVVHCDVSLNNLLVTYQGAVKVLDFGVARFEEHLRRTTGVSLKGTVAYIAPEQLGDRLVSAKADIWSLAVCLYELLTLRPLFSGTNTAAILQQILHAPIAPPSAFRAEIPSEVDALLLRALQRAPEARFESAEAFAHALRAALPATGEGAPRLDGALREMFGQERAEQVLRQATPHVAMQIPATEALATRTLVPATSTSPTLSAGKPRRTFVVGALLLATAGAAGAALLLRGNPPAEKILYRAEIASTPPGATLFLDGQRRAELTPTTLTDAGPGRHVLRLEKEGFVSAETPIELGPERPLAQVVIQLSREEPAPREPEPQPEEVAKASRTVLGPALLTLDCNVDAEIWVDDKPAGKAPLRRWRVPAGRHRVRVANRELGLTRQLLVDLRADAETKRRVDFGKGKLSVSATPWADVFLDGKGLGQTPLASRDVWEGQHTLELVGPERRKTLSIVVRRGQTTAVNERFQ